MKVCVIGGSGFIGTTLCGLLSDDANLSFVIVDKQLSESFPSNCSLADVRSTEALSAAIHEDSIIINLAAEHRDNVSPVSLYDDVNVTGAINICEIARQKRVQKIIFTSTVAVYGFAPIGTDESGQIAPFNDYGRTKAEAEAVFKAWQSEDAASRCLVIVRPTVVFGKRNRGNVYNLLRQVGSGFFVMIGDGRNRKSMAYVENVVAFLRFSMAFAPGIHIYNYVDKPDFDMNKLIKLVRGMFGKRESVGMHLPFAVGYAIGKCFDAASRLTGLNYKISAIRVKKFCANSVYSTAVNQTGFVVPVPMETALQQTIRYEFLEQHTEGQVFQSE